MTEIEANLWFCCGPSMQETLENEVHQWRPDFRPNNARPTHLQMCGREDFDENTDWHDDTFRSKYPASYQEYNILLKKWKRGGQQPFPFRVSAASLVADPKSNSSFERIQANDPNSGTQPVFSFSRSWKQPRNVRISHYGLRF